MACLVHVSLKMPAKTQRCCSNTASVAGIFNCERYAASGGALNTMV
ncbi:hypothetical protein ACR6HW_14995 [Fusibacter sp. JL298sf-3]